MENAIEQTKQLILEAYEKELYFEKDNNYGHLFACTNENVKAYLSNLKVKKGQKALSVLASGDQVFNLVAKGIFDIDTFDINKLTEYYALGFKRALIDKYNYTQYLDIFDSLFHKRCSVQRTGEIINDVLPLMDQKYRTYWQKIFDFYYKLEKEEQKSLNLFPILTYVHEPKLQQANIYLNSQKDYNKFKRNLMRANIAFQHANATDLAKIFQGKYDYLLLSNILDYVFRSWGKWWDIEKLNEYLKSLEPIMQSNALIFLHYCFYYDSRVRPISNAYVEFSDFRSDEICCMPNLNACDVEAAMILKRINAK